MKDPSMKDPSMKDTISSRITRIIAGTANSIVSRIEGLAPEAILEQAILEVDGAIDEVRAELGRILVQKHHVTRALGRLNEEHAKLDEQIDEAVKQTRDDLAEVAIGRQVAQALQVERLAPMAPGLCLRS